VAEIIKDPERAFAAELLRLAAEVKAATGQQPAIYVTIPGLMSMHYVHGEFGGLQIRAPVERKADG
jgi:hypothetical protein